MVVRQGEHGTFRQPIFIHRMVFTVRAKTRANGGNERPMRLRTMHKRRKRKLKVRWRAQMHITVFDWTRFSSLVLGKYWHEIPGLGAALVTVTDDGISQAEIDVYSHRAVQARRALEDLIKYDVLNLPVIGAEPDRIDDIRPRVLKGKML